MKTLVLSHSAILIERKSFIEHLEEAILSVNIAKPIIRLIRFIYI